MYFRRFHVTPYSSKPEWSTFEYYMDRLPALEALPVGEALALARKIDDASPFSFDNSIVELRQTGVLSEAKWRSIAEAQVSATLTVEAAGRFVTGHRLRGVMSLANERGWIPTAQALVAALQPGVVVGSWSELCFLARVPWTWDAADFVRLLSMGLREADTDRWLGELLSCVVWELLLDAQTDRGDFWTALIALKDDQEPRLQQLLSYLLARRGLITVPQWEPAFVAALVAALFRGNEDAEPSFWGMDAALGATIHEAVRAHLRSHSRGDIGSRHLILPLIPDLSERLAFCTASVSSDERIGWLTPKLPAAFSPEDLPALKALLASAETPDGDRAVAGLVAIQLAPEDAEVRAAAATACRLIFAASAPATERQETMVEALSARLSRPQLIDVLQQAHAHPEVFWGMGDSPALKTAAAIAISQSRRERGRYWTNFVNKPRVAWLAKADPALAVASIEGAGAGVCVDIPMTRLVGVSLSADLQTRLAVALVPVLGHKKKPTRTQALALLGSLSPAAQQAAVVAGSKSRKKAIKAALASLV